MVLKEFLKTLEIKKFIDETGINTEGFIIPTILIMISSVFEGISMGLLAPLGKGVIEMNFTFLTQSRYIEQIFSYVPIKFQTNLELFTLLISIILVSISIKVATQYLAERKMSYETEKFVTKLRKKIYHKYLTLGKEYFDKNNIGKLTNSLINFTEIIGEKLRTFHQTLRAISTIIIYFIIMVIISWQLSLFSLIVFPAILLTINIITKKIKTRSIDYAKTQEDLSKESHDILNNTTLVKMYSKENEEKEKFNKLSDKLASIRYRMLKKNVLLKPLQETLIIVATIMITSFVALLIFSGNSKNLAGFILFFILLRRIALSTQIYTSFRGAIAQIHGPSKEISKILKIEAPKIIGGKKTFNGLNKKIEIKNLTFSYEDNLEILKKINLTIKKGKTTAIVGPSGSGKTTITSLILRLYDCKENKIFIDDEDIKEFSLKSLRKNMALISQETLLFNTTLRKNITYGKENIDEKTLNKIIKKSRLKELINRLPNGLETIIGDKGVRLSGGEKQRVAIARALIKDANILILDEATSSLDSTTEKLIQEAINEAIKGKTSIIIAHRLSTIKNADKIIVLENGRIIEEGKPEELLKKKSRFHRYWQEQKYN